MGSRDNLWVERKTRDQKTCVWFLVEVVGEFSSPELTLCADSYSVSVLLRVTAVARKKSTTIILSKVQVPKHSYTFDSTMSE